MIINGVPNISINLNNGLYFFDGDAAIGKSYLAEVLSAHTALRDDIYVGTFMNNKFIDFGDTKTSKVNFFDRCDKYLDLELIKNIINLSIGSVVLVDLKNLSLINDYLKGVNWGFVDIELKKDELVVGD